MKTKRILVAGATGYLGGFVARELSRRGCSVRALVRSPEKLGDLESVIDEVIVGEVTKPDTLAHACDGIDVVFSSVGITRQKDGLTFRDVDYRGNKNLLDTALAAGVTKFVYISVFNGPNLPHLAIVKAHEDFVDELEASGIDSVVVRPTGFFSDMSDVLEMAKKGRVYLIGPGDNRVNPIHGADLAEVCADAVDDDQHEIDVGGPEVLTYREIAELAFRAAGTSPRITTVPVWAMKAVIAATRIFNRHHAELLAFFTTAMTTEVVAPPAGTRTLGEHFSEIA
jgi:uncharacterized protein YbjT (DUF2867 family)